MSYHSLYSIYIEYKDASAIPANIDDFSERCVRAIYDLGYEASVSCEQQPKDINHWSYIEEDFYYRVYSEWNDDDDVSSLEPLIEQALDVLKPIFGFKNYEIDRIT